MPNFFHKVLSCKSSSRGLFWSLMLLTALIGFSACAHQPILAQQGHKPSLSIPLLKNTTFEPLLEKTLTSIFKTALYEQGWQINADDQSEGDSSNKVLEGKITGFSRHPISLNQLGSVIEYRINMTIKVVLLGSKNRAKRFSRTINGEAEYIARSDSGEDRIAKDRAIREAGRDMADQLLAFLQADLLQANSKAEAHMEKKEMH